MREILLSHVLKMVGVCRDVCIQGINFNLKYYSIWVHWSIKGMTLNLECGCAHELNDGKAIKTLSGDQKLLRD